MRDFQRGLVYQSEKAICQILEPAILSQDECRDLVSEAIWSEGFLSLRVRVIFTNFQSGKAMKRLGNYIIKLPPFACRKYYVLHEVAHILQFQNADWRDRAPHGPEWRKIYLKLLHRFTPEFAEGLEIAFRECNIIF